MWCSVADPAVSRTGREGLFPTLEAGFVRHASLEAIRADTRCLQTKRQAINAQIGDLLRLKDERERQVREGEWPSVISQGGNHEQG